MFSPDTKIVYFILLQTNNKEKVSLGFCSRKVLAILMAVSKSSSELVGFDKSCLYESLLRFPFIDYIEPKFKSHQFNSSASTKFEVNCKTYHFKIS